MPHSNTLFQLMNPLLCLFLVYGFYNSRRWKPYVLMAVIPVALSLLINLSVSSQKALLSAFTIMLYFFCFPLVGRVQVRNIYMYLCLVYIVVSQFVYLLDIQFLTDFFNTAYPIGEDDRNAILHMQSNITYGTILNYRLGGIYHNANQCARYLCMLLAFFLVTNQDQKNKGVLIFSGIVYASILLTGSRTGFVVASLILYFGLFRQKSYKGTIRYIFIAMAVLGLVYIVSSGVSFRGFGINRGFQNSANLKWDTFVYYLQQETNPVYLLLGHLDTSLFTGQSSELLSSFDSEYGDLIFSYGFVGFLSILIFWWMTARHIEKTKRFFFILLLWIITSTIVASYRAFFIFILLLSVIHSNYGLIIRKNKH